jgi:enoyl-CoA hydratase/carnithine racemase
MMSFVRIEDPSPGVRHVVLDRANRRNALSERVVDELADALGDAAGDPDVDVIVLRAAGPSFSAGIDSATLAEFDTHDRVRRIRGRFLRAAQAAAEAPKPVVAAIQGHCVGAGFEIALACDLRVAADDAVVGLPETRIGAVPDVGGCSRLAALVGLGRAKELVLTGALVDASRALELGLVNRVVERDALGDAVDELVAELTACSTAANGLAKRILDHAATPALANTLEQELVAQLAVCETERYRTGIAAFAAGRARA